MGYLLLARRTNERIILLLDDGREIDILISRISPDCVDVGVDAPRDIKILKRETHLQDLRRGRGSAINDQPRQNYSRD